MYQKKDMYVHISLGFADEIMSLKEVRRSKKAIEYENPTRNLITPYILSITSVRLQITILSATQDVEIQCELDENMTIRTLPLEVQGFLESYMAVVNLGGSSGSKA